MVYKFVEATSLKEGNYLIIDDAPCVLKRIDISKTGKHGASKVRIEAIGIIDGKKRIAVMPGHEKVGVPLIEKKRGQILSIFEKKANVMDLDSFETFDMIIDEEALGKISEGDNVEYWDVEGVKIVKRRI
ncbi:MAG: translation initiation factor IF-5A [Candidatus Pacearchaeota archaeon]